MLNDDVLDRLVATTSRLDDDAVARLGLGPAHDELLEELLAKPAPTRRGHRRSWLVLAAVLAIFAVIGTPVWLSRDRSTIDVASQPVQQADPNLQLLLELPGWRIDNVATDNGSGSIRFVNGDRDLEVDAKPARLYDGYYQDRIGVSAPEPVTTLGQAGALVTYGPHDHAVILPTRGRTFLELRGQGSDLPAFLDLLDHLQRVSQKEWLAAMPESVVKPDDQRAVVDQMLTGVPLPPGFEVGSVRSEETSDYYQFGAAVTDAVACGWIDAYRTASAQGDTAGQAAAVDALESSRTWSVLKKMDREGDWPEAIWDYAEELRDGKLRPQAQYAAGLGCHR